MEFTDILIPILMFCVPLLAAVVDARKKALKKLQAEAEEIEEAEAFQAEGVSSSEPPLRKGTAMPIPAHTEEGTHSIEKRQRASKIEEKKSNMLSKENIDKKKLVLYSEIMKPKFDE